MRSFLLLLSFLFTTAACRDTKPEGGAAAAAGSAPVVIRFERTPCMGECPAFVAEISADGTMRYAGRRFSPKEGDFKAQLNPGVVSAIRAEARAMQFATLPADEYGRGMMDAPSAILTIDGHTVKCTGGECPETLTSLHQYLDQEIRAALGVPEPD